MDSNKIQHIETIKDTNTLIKEIQKQNKEFDLKDFFTSNGDVNGSVKIITPKQSIGVYAKQRHYTVIEKIYSLMYPDFKGFLKSKKRYKSWREEAIEKGNIFMQLCSITPSLIYLPDEISQTQCEELARFIAEVNEINKYLKGVNKNQLDFFINAQGFENKILYSDEIEQVLEQAEERTNYNILENPIECVVQDIKVKDDFGRYAI